MHYRHCHTIRQYVDLLSGVYIGVGAHVRMMFQHGYPQETVLAYLKRLERDYIAAYERLEDKRELGYLEGVFE